jgi:4,5:9,10-diseco-3-hydroxy-5,9,17-trioxoandrosta-1(10),2-diene-4-oate hydrolase
MSPDGNSSFPPSQKVDLKSGLTMTYRDMGSGPVVIFLHGSGPGASGHSNFKLNYPVIAEKGYRTIIPDMIGFGGSSKPADIQYVLDFFRDTLIEFIDAIGIDRCTLVGNSLGGGIAMAMTLNRPELVEKLVLMAPGGIEPRWAYFRMPAMRKMVSGFIGAGFDREGLGKLLSLLLFDTKHATDELIDERLEVLKTQPKEVLSTMRVQDMTEDLPNLTCPILGFWGVEDEFNPVSGAMKIVSACPNARMTLFAKCGHWVMVEYADAFNRAVLDFLAE